ncbi:hypothetical protein LTR62_007108 [Meristemomyces frigidus]|uniref:Protein SSH4 n=1 Tax=Meristemomyces frigidus TaxID=1508187 RepID=A0AAN7YP71_9PEZI|nr:hypothetical protein LTR62_007108 [Meristemomyces frigidus]
MDMGEHSGPVLVRPGSGWRSNRTDPPFFTPSYLSRSRHVHRLHREHRRDLEEQREMARQDSISHQPVPPSNNSSTVSLHKTPTAHTIYHRGIVQDVIERSPPQSEEDKTCPLPSRWSEEDKPSGLEIQGEGTEVRFIGSPKTSDEAASIRSDHPMPQECGIYYYEVTIMSRGKDGMIGIGFSTKKASLYRLPGWENESWAYHGDDGYAFAMTASGKQYGPRFASNDVIGCGVNFRTGEAFFTKNGVYLGVAFPPIPSDKISKLHPSVGMKKPNEHLRVNFGQTPFVFDIDRMMEQERHTIMNDIRKVDVEQLHPPDDQHTLIHKLIGQYLAHEGYVETARAFSQDVHEQLNAISGDTLPFEPPESDDDVHAVNRQKIRKSILDGDIDRALKYTNSYYPHVLEDQRNRDIYFRLKCRKFIEMMRRYAELVATTSSPITVTKFVAPFERHNQIEADDQAYDPEDEDDADDTQMELDDQLQRETSKSLDLLTDDIDMDASQEMPPSRKGSHNKQEDLQVAALAYGRELQMEFGGHDAKPETKKELLDLGAIWAYNNPAESPIAGLLDTGKRGVIAEEVNGAILGRLLLNNVIPKAFICVLMFGYWFLVSLGKPSSAALEKLCAQTEALLDEAAAKGGGAAAFVRVCGDLLAP